MTLHSDTSGRGYCINDIKSNIIYSRSVQITKR